MQLIHLKTGQPVRVGDTLIAVQGVINGQAIKVQEICPPSDRFGDGLIKHNMTTEGGAGWQQLFPRVLDCVFVPDDSKIDFVSYDNEKSVAVYLREIIDSLKAQGRVARRFIVGDKEWTRIAHVVDYDYTDEFGCTYMAILGWRVSEYTHYETLIAVEHTLESNEVNDGSSSQNADDSERAHAAPSDNS